MNNLNDGELPKYWRGPTPELHPCLLSDATDQALATLKVSRDDVKRWQSHGWISFDVDARDRLDWNHANEIEFVRNVARSGLLDAQIDSLFESLPKPYRFPVENTAYHFAYGWVAPRQDDPFDVIENSIIDWIDDLAEREDTARLQEISEKIAEHLEELEYEEETDAENEGD